MPNPPLLLKMISTVLLSVIAIILFLLDKNSKARKLCMIAMILCTLGDFFMTNIFKINSLVTMAIGASLFISGHICYGGMFRELVKDNNSKLVNNGFYIGFIVALLPLIVMLILAYTIAPIKPFILYVIFVPVYTLVIGYHIACDYSYSFSIKSYRSIILMLGVTLFYVTDIWIFLNMYNLCNIESAIWHFYPLAQLLIIVFSKKINLIKK